MQAPQRPPASAPSLQATKKNHKPEGKVPPHRAGCGPPLRVPIARRYGPPLTQICNSAHAQAVHNACYPTTPGGPLPARGGVARPVWVPPAAHARLASPVSLAGGRCRGGPVAFHACPAFRRALDPPSAVLAPGPAVKRSNSIAPVGPPTPPTANCIVRRLTEDRRWGGGGAGLRCLPCDIRVAPV